MGEVETRGPQALDSSSGCCRTTSAGSPRAGRSTACIVPRGRRDPRRPNHLPAGRLFLTVTNAANHRRTSPGSAPTPPSSTSMCVDVADRFAMLAVQGPRARTLVRGLADGQLPGRMHCCERDVGGMAMLVCGTGYTGEDGVELLLIRTRRRRCGTPCSARAWTPSGWGPRHTAARGLLPPVRQRHGRGRNPIEAGLGWACKEQTGFIGAEAVARGRAAGPDRSWCPSRSAGPGSPGPGNPVVGGGVR